MELARAHQNNSSDPDCAKRSSRWLESMSTDQILAASVFAASMIMATPAAAEIVLLDCAVTARSDSNYRGREASQVEDGGTWRFRLDTEGRHATLEERPFAFRVSIANGVPLKLREPVSLALTEDTYSFCLELSGKCGQQTTTQRGGWYNVHSAIIDRRRGTFRLLIESHNDLLQGSALHTYSGNCQRAPEQQF